MAGCGLFQRAVVTVVTAETDKFRIAWFCMLLHRFLGIVCAGHFISIILAQRHQRKAARKMHRLKSDQQLTVWMLNYDH